MFRTLSVKGLLLSVATIVIATFVLLAFTVWTTTNSIIDTASNMGRGKDIVADILPPPLHLIEAHLIAHGLVTPDPDQVPAKIAQFERLKTVYDKRYAYWASAPLGADLTNALVVAQRATADRYWDFLFSEFIPEVQRGDPQRIRRQLAELSRLYEAHHETVDASVVLASQFSDQTAKELTETASVMRVFVALVTISGGLVAAGLLFLTIRSVLALLGGEPRAMREVARQIADGQMQIDLIPAYGGDDSLAAAMVRMKENLQRVMAQLDHERTQLRTLVSALPDLVWLKDPAGVYLTCNPRMERLFGAGEADIIGKTDYDFVPQELADLFRENDSAAIRAGGPSTNEEPVTFADDGHQELLETIKTPMYDQAGNLVGVLGVGRDITERKRHEQEIAAANKRLHALSVQVLSAQEDERRNLARELHDEVGQSLTALKLTLQAVEQRTEAAAIAVRLCNAIAIADDTLNRVRRMSLDLRPPQLDELGLAAALRWNLERQAQASGLGIAVDIGELPPQLPDVLATTCYRVVQEAVTNVLRHARAHQVEVALHHADGQMVLRVRDDGRGFDVAAARERATHGAGFGLSGMQERVALAGGTLSIESAPGSGSEVRASFALTGGDERD